LYMNRLIYLLITLLCSLRAIQLYLSSTKALRPTEGHSWFSPSIHDNGHSIIKNDSIVLGTESHNIFYFVHVTDLHLSRFRPKGHTFHFLHFIQSILPVVKPEFVIVTGDLTDAKDKKRVTSQQYIDEWDVYQTAINEKVNTKWYDIRGNHDCFNLPSWKSRVNYYSTHGKSADLVEQGKGIYTWQLNKPEVGNYQFVAIDACPKRGPSRPLNFFGYLTSKTMDQLEKALTLNTFNHTFLFSHYPTTTMVFGIGDVLKSYNPITKSLELELGDLKEHGLYRIVAIDHDLISFVDLQLPLDQIPKRGPVNSAGLVQPMQDDKIIWPNLVHPSPSILVTNPKDARFSIPTKEPLWRIRQSTHIRFLVFSEEEETEKISIEIKINGQLHPNPAIYVGDTKNPLWVSPWDPSLLEDRKTHQLSIRITTPNGKSSISETVFRTDMYRAKIGGGSGEFIIKSKMALVVSHNNNYYKKKIPNLFMSISYNVLLYFLSQAYYFYCLFLNFLFLNNVSVKFCYVFMQ
ncbi:Metallo-dependent phosphatase-like protein, partial [Cokeromyces recurvatus]|uniref:Metallo-dependent phosphatase-like protein n=1 Tax=Cokeromyces recurvatus TaxID=90255 RepID=UPI00221EFB44